MLMREPKAHKATSAAQQTQLDLPYGSLHLQCLLNTSGSSLHSLLSQLGLLSPCLVQLSSMLCLEVINEQQGPLAVCTACTALG